MPTLPGTAQITLNINTSVAMMTDINTFWKLQVSAKIASVQSTLGSGGTILAIDKISTTVPQQGGVNVYGNNQTTITIQAGSTILVGNEEMSVDSVAGPDEATGNYTLTVSRGPLQTAADGSQTSFPMAVAVDHNPGDSVSLLTYVSPWEMVRSWLLDKAVDVQKSLGPNSAVFASSASGSVTIS